MRFIDFASTLSAFDARMTLAPRVQQELGAFLDVRLKIAERARTRDSSVLGRLGNALSGEHPDYLRLTASELQDVLQLLGVEADDIVDQHTLFDLRVDVAEEAFSKIREHTSAK